jgi:hypothetical protein
MPEGVPVEGSDGHQGFAEHIARDAQRPQRQEEVVFRDAELQVLPLGAFGPFHRHGNVAFTKVIGSDFGRVHPDFLDPTAQIRGNGDIRTDGHQTAADIRIARQFGEDVAKRLLSGNGGSMNGGERFGNA